MGRAVQQQLVGGGGDVRQFTTNDESRVSGGGACRNAGWQDWAHWLGTDTMPPSQISQAFPALTDSQAMAPTQARADDGTCPRPVFPGMLSGLTMAPVHVHIQPSSATEHEQPRDQSKEHVCPTESLGRVPRVKEMSFPPHQMCWLLRDGEKDVQWFPSCSAAAKHLHGQRFECNIHGARMRKARMNSETGPAAGRYQGPCGTQYSVHAHDPSEQGPHRKRFKHTDGVVHQADNYADNVPESSGHADTQFYTVEAVLGERVEGGEPRYLVKWAGYGEEHSTWEPRSNLDDCTVFLAHLRNTAPTPNRALAPAPTSADTCWGSQATGRRVRTGVATSQHSSVYKGVSWNRSSSRWDAYAWYQGRKHHFPGGFDEEVEAARAADTMARKVGKQVVNFPQNTSEKAANLAAKAKGGHAAKHARAFAGGSTSATLDLGADVPLTTRTAAGSAASSESVLDSELDSELDSSDGQEGEGEGEEEGDGDGDVDEDVDVDEDEGADEDEDEDEDEGEDGVMPTAVGGDDRGYTAAEDGLIVAHALAYLTGRRPTSGAETAAGMPHTAGASGSMNMHVPKAWWQTIDLTGPVWKQRTALSVLCRYAFLKAPLRRRLEQQGGDGSDAADSDDSDDDDDYDDDNNNKYDDDVNDDDDDYYTDDNNDDDDGDGKPDDVGDSDDAANNSYAKEKAVAPTTLFERAEIAMDYPADAKRRRTSATATPDHAFTAAAATGIAATATANSLMIGSRSNGGGGSSNNNSTGPAACSCKTPNHQDTLFCDGCDEAFPLCCTGLVAVPRSEAEWLCAGCSGSGSHLG